MVLSLSAKPSDCSTGSAQYLPSSPQAAIGHEAAHLADDDHSEYAWGLRWSLGFLFMGMGVSVGDARASWARWHCRRSGSTSDCVLR
ncbi:hypothetical protein GCM10027404_12410 [Arthrobacter tumbae]|nr:hypothetical protein [Arthrobacter tumbae]